MRSSVSHLHSCKCHIGAVAAEYAIVICGLVQRPEHEPWSPELPAFELGFTIPVFICAYIQRAFHLLFSFSTTDSYVTSWFYLITALDRVTFAVNLSLNLAAPPCVSPQLTRKGKVLETCEDALVVV